MYPVHHSRSLWWLWNQKNQKCYPYPWLRNHFSRLVIIHIINSHFDLFISLCDTRHPLEVISVAIVGPTAHFSSSKTYLDTYSTSWLQHLIFWTVVWIHMAHIRLSWMILNGLMKQHVLYCSWTLFWYKFPYMQDKLCLLIFAKHRLRSVLLSLLLLLCALLHVMWPMIAAKESKSELTLLYVTATVNFTDMTVLSTAPVVYMQVFLFVFDGSMAICKATCSNPCHWCCYPGLLPGQLPF